MIAITERWWFPILIMLTMMYVLSNNRKVKDVQSIIVAKVEEQPSYQKEFAFVIFTENGKKHIVGAVTYSRLSIGQLYSYQEKENLTSTGKFMLSVLALLLLTVLTLQVFKYCFVD
jgi:hypothetical protein